MTLKLSKINDIQSLSDTVEWKIKKNNINIYVSEDELRNLNEMYSNNKPSQLVRLKCMQTMHEGKYKRNEKEFQARGGEMKK